MKYKMIVLSNSVDGMDEEFNEWYDNVHIEDVTKLEGITSAKRFSFHSNVIGGSTERKYLTIYDIKTNNVDEVVNNLIKIVENDEIYISESLDMSTVDAMIYKEI